MYVLYAHDGEDLRTKSDLFEIFFNPLLKKLERAIDSGHVPTDLPEIAQYLQVCRWPFRKLEYSLALDALLSQLKPGSCYLDAGCGVTPLAHVIAGHGIRAHACDGDARLIGGLARLDPEAIYETAVHYSIQDLTSISYLDESFDAVSCVSVLEHIPAPLDQFAARELLRVLKPGGALVLTVDFAPSESGGKAGRLAYFGRRVAQMIRAGQYLEVARAISRKLHAYELVQTGAVNQPRTANQSFGVEHLEQDILPQLAGEELEGQLSWDTDLRMFTPEIAKRFWDLKPGLFDLQGQRAVLPAALVLRKPERISGAVKRA